jgi:hypothetical protein
VKRKTFASARFGVCANVFTQSRIHFDARLSLPLAAALLDKAYARRSDEATDAFEDDHVSPPPSPGDLQTTVH